MEKQTLIRRLAECFDAFGAQYLLDHATLLHDRNLLQIRFECAIGCMLGERALVTEGGCFTAGATFHVGCPFNTMIPVLALSVCRRVNSSFQRHGILPYNATIFKI
jgi:hypothetical protein